MAAAASGADFESLPVHRVIGDLLCLDRLESAGSNVKGEKRMRHLRQNLRCEMQSCGRCGNGAGIPRIYSLVTLCVARLGLAPEIRRDWNCADPLQIDRLRKLDHALPRRPHFLDHSADTAYRRGGAAGQLPARLDHAEPAILSSGLEKEKLDAAIIRKCAGGNHLRVVEHRQITRFKKTGELRKLPVLDPARIAMEHHHSRGGAVRQADARR